MAASTWTIPAWTKKVPGVSFDKEIELLSSLAQQAAAVDCRVVPESELEFDTREFADLVIERNSDHSKLLFGLTQKGPNDPNRVDVLTRPRTGHAILRQVDGKWRLILGASFLYNESVEKLELPGLLRVLLDNRA